MRGALVKRHVAAYLSEAQGAAAFTKQIQDGDNSIEPLQLVNAPIWRDLLAVGAMR